VKWIKVNFVAGRFVLASGRKPMKYLDLESMQMDLFSSEKVKFKIISVNGKKFNKAKVFIYKKKKKEILVRTKSGKTQYKFDSKTSMVRFFDSCRKSVYPDFELMREEFQAAGPNIKKRLLERKEYEEHENYVPLTGPHSGDSDGTSVFGALRPLKRMTKGGCNYMINGEMCGRYTHGIEDKCDQHN
jgi:hypothetical protein